MSRIFVHVYIKPSTRRNENINRFSDFNSIYQRNREGKGKIFQVTKLNEEEEEDRI